MSRFGDADRLMTVENDAGSPMNSQSMPEEPNLSPNEVGAGRYFFFVVACIVVLAGMITFALRIPPPPPPPEIKADPVLAQGYNVYMRQCVPCHGLQGLGDGPRAFSAAIKPRNLRDEPWKFGEDDESVRRIILKGGPNGAMPAFEASLTKSEVSAVVRYVRQFKKP